MSGNPSAGRVQEVEGLISGDLAANAREAGVDVSEVVAETVDEYAGYGAQTQKRFAESAIQQQIDAQGATATKGILCGSRDRYGKNWPRRYALIRSDGDHIEASSWDSSLPTSSGQEMEIPSGAAVEIRLEHDAEYDSYEAKQLDGVTQLEHEELANRLSSVAVSPGDLGRGDKFETVAVRAEIAFVNPQTVFEDGEPQGDGPVMLEDERGEPKPHFEVVLEQESGTRVRGHVERQRYAEPFFQIEDFEKLTRDAQENFRSPDEQAGFLMDALRGREVVVVGNMNSYSQNRRDDGSTVNYVDLGVAGIVEIPDSPPEPSPDPTPEPENTESESGDTESSGDDASATKSPSDSPSKTKLNAITQDIKNYADLVGLSDDDLSVEVIEENTEIDAPESVIRAAIENMGVDTSPPADETGGGDDTDETPDDPVEACYDSDAGQYVCPAHGCLFSASGKAGLFGHIAGDHSPPEGDLDAWVANQVGE